MTLLSGWIGQDFVVHKMPDYHVAQSLDECHRTAPTMVVQKPSAPLSERE